MTVSAAEPIKFAYWVPNVSGGLVISTIEQRTVGYRLHEIHRSRRSCPGNGPEILFDRRAVRLSRADRRGLSR